MRSKQKMEPKKEDNQVSEEYNSFGPPRVPLLKRLESTEYFEGCSDPEEVFGANVSEIMASFALQSNDDINLADLATPRGYNMGTPGGKLNLETINETSTNLRTNNAFGSLRRHSSIHISHNAEDPEFEFTEAPPGFRRSRFNSRSYGGAPIGLNENVEQLDNEQFTVPASMMRNQPRYSKHNSKRRFTLEPETPVSGAVEPDFSAIEKLGENLESQTLNYPGYPSADIQYSEEYIDFERRESRRHSSPPKGPSLLPPSDILGNPNYQGNYMNHTELEPQMDVNAQPFSPSFPKQSNGNSWYPQSPPQNILPQNLVNQPLGPPQTVPPRNRTRRTNFQASSGPETQRYTKASGQRTAAVTDSLVGKVLQLSKDSQGSRIIQQKMEAASASEKKVLIDEIIDEVINLSCHPFGNYVVQNFLQHSTDQQLNLLASRFFGNLVKVSNDTHGCRAIQFAFDVVSLPLRNRLIDEVCENIVAISKNNHGTHVVQKCLGFLTHEVLKLPRKIAQANDALCKASKAPTSGDLLGKIELKVCDDFLRLAIHPYSYRLIQFTLADCNENRSPTMSKIFSQVRKNYAALALDQHGNFILQHVLDKGSQAQVSDVQAFVCSRVFQLGQHKFGSHLVEKCLTTGTAKQAANFVLEILKPTGENASYLASNTNVEKDGLLLLCKDPYANFVVQKAYKYAPTALKSSLRDEIYKREEVLSRYNYGKHILAKVKN